MFVSWQSWLHHECLSAFYYLNHTINQWGVNPQKLFNVAISALAAAKAC